MHVQELRLPTACYIWVLPDSAAVQKHRVHMCPVCVCVTAGPGAGSGSNYQRLKISDHVNDHVMMKISAEIRQLRIQCSNTRRITSLEFTYVLFVGSVAWLWNRQRTQ